MIERLIWDSDFFGYNVGKITIFDNIFNELEFKKNAKDFKLAYLFSNQELPVSSDIKLYDIKTVFEKDINNQVIDIPSILEFDPSIHSYEELEELIYLSGTFSRFKLDNNFKNNEFKKLYKAWLDNSLDESYAFKVFVKIIKNTVAGFVTIKKNNENTSEIGLIAVSDAFQGKGIASELIQKAEYESYTKGFKSFRVPTQFENKQAVKLYLKNGFEIVEKIYIYHYWNLK